MKPENWMKWDIHSRSDKFTKFYLNTSTNRAEAYGLLIWLIELCYQESDGWIALDEMTLTVLETELATTKESICKAIAKLIEAKLFIAQEREQVRYIASKRALKEIAKRTVISKVRSEVGRKGGINSGISKQTESKPEAIAKQIESKPKQREREREEIDKRDERERGDTHAQEPKNFTDEEKERYKLAESKLEQPGDGTKYWESSEQFLNAGRRPLIRFPDIYFATDDLVEVIRQYERCGLYSRFREGLMKAKGRLDNMKVEGRDIEAVSVFNWMTSWIKIELLEEVNKETRLEKTQERGTYEQPRV